MMSVTRTRTRGDDYPILITFRARTQAQADAGEEATPVDLLGAVVKFSYKNETQTVLTITGTNTDNIGEAEFIPNKGTDFEVSGVFQYDAQRVDASGYTYTHETGTLIIDGDITV